MLQQLDADALRSVAMACAFADALSVRQTCADARRGLDDRFFREHALATWGEAFWHRAALRPRHACRPLPTWRQELLRMQRYREVLCGAYGRCMCDAEFLSHLFDVWRFDVFVPAPDHTDPMGHH